MKREFSEKASQIAGLSDTEVLAVQNPGTRTPLSVQNGPAQRAKRSGRKAILTVDEKKRRRRIRDRIRNGYSIEDAQDERRKKSGPKGPRLSFEERQKRKKDYRRAARERSKSDPQKREAARAFMRRYWRKTRGLPPDSILPIGRPSKLQLHQLEAITDAYRQLRSWRRVAKQFGVCPDTMRKFISKANQRAMRPGSPPDTCSHIRRSAAAVDHHGTRDAITIAPDWMSDSSRRSDFEMRQDRPESLDNRMMNAAELTRLDAFLKTLRKPFSSVQMLDGFLVALQLCPKPSYDLELIRLLLSKSRKLDHPSLSSPKDANDFLDLILRHRSNIRTALGHNMAYLTVLHELPRRSSAVKAWCTGFVKALHEDQEHWRPHLRNKQIARWIAPIYQIGNGNISFCPEIKAMPPRRPGEEADYLQIITCLNRLMHELHASSPLQGADDADLSIDESEALPSPAPSLLAPFKRPSHLN